MLRGHIAEEKEIYGLLEAKTLLLYEAGHYVLYVDTAVIELAVAVVSCAVSGIEHLNSADIGKTGNNTVAVYVSETSLTSYWV